MKFKALLRFSLITAAILVPSISHAKSLAESIQTAWQNHPSIDAAQASQGFAHREIKEEYSAYLPDLNISAFGGREFANNSTSRGLNTVRGEGYSGTWEGNVALRQNFFDGGGRDGRVNAARARKKIAQTTMSDVQDILAASVSASYIELLRVYSELSALSQHRQSVSDYVDRINQAAQQGSADEAEYRQALEINLSLDAIEVDLETQLKNAEAAYYEAVGEMPQGELSTPDILSAVLPVDAQAAISMARAVHPALKRARQQSKSASYEVEAERAGFYPKIDGELSYLKSEREDIIGGEAEIMKAIMRMNWNFEFGGGAFHRISKRKFKHEESLANARDIERQVAQGIQLAYAEYEGALQQLLVQNKRLALSTDLLDTYREQFEGARVSMLQLMQAENQMFLAKLEEIAAQHRVLNAQYAILSAIGQSKIAVSPLTLAKANNDER